MLRICSKALVGMVKHCHLTKPVSATLVAGRTLTQQKGLPRVPVTPLHKICELYLSILEPIVDVDKLKRTKELVKEFQKANGVGERLQRSLERKACNTENWLSDHYEKHDNLTSRLPVVIHSNISTHFPQMDFRDNQGQIRYAAKSIAALLDLKTMIDNETLPVEYIGGKPLCMKQYEQIISSCRIPGLKTDSMVFHGKSSTPPKHITVVHNNQFFWLDVYKSDGTLLTVDELCVQLEWIYNASLQTNMEPVGILTTQHRDVWSKIYINLIKDKTNKESVSAIQSSIFTLCLDGALPPVSEEMYCSSAYLQMLHGGGSQGNSGNRWFDKGMQVIIGEDGICGCNLSHAVSDGQVGMILCDHIVAYINRKMPQMMQSPTEPLPVPQKLHFNITPELKKNIEVAKKHMDILEQYLDVRVMVFDHFGKNVIKVHRMSPDAFVQIALQLAYYRMYQRCCATYESVSLRMFRRGRLNFLNANTSASATFAKAFDDPKIQNLEKVDLLKKAMKAHRWYTNLALSGQALECHLLCLKMQAVEENISMPDIFTDTSFKKAFDYKIAASQVTSKTGFLPCAGPDDPSKCNFFYLIMNDHIDLILISVKASETCKDTNAPHLIQAVKDALLDMRNLLE